MAIDVLAALDAQVASARSLQSDAYWQQELPKLIELRIVVGAMAEALRQVEFCTRGGSRIEGARTKSLNTTASAALDRACASKLGCTGGVA